MKPKVRGITKVRNEADIIKETLDRWAEICDGGIYVYDDVSSDKTREICASHPAVREVIKGEFWDPDREKAEWKNRQTALVAARHDASTEGWIACFDADEHPYDLDDLSFLSDDSIDAISMRLYDVYITPEDVDKNYLEREWIGPEFRTITMLFRDTPEAVFHLPDQRIPTLRPGAIAQVRGTVKHFGKGISVEQWEKTCDYYSRFWPKYAEKWQNRKGMAVHIDMLSDFGNPLIKWEDRRYGITLEDKPYGKA